jgi:hypothetical protein
LWPKERREAPEPKKRNGQSVPPWIEGNREGLSDDPSDLPPSPPSLEDVKRALSVVDPDTDRQAWFEIGCALHSWGGEVGLDLWDTWSSRGTKYKSGEMQGQRDSIKRGNYPYTIATLFYYADQANPNWRRSGERADTGQDNSAADDRKEPKSTSDKVLLDPADPMRSARALVDRLYTESDGKRIMHRHRVLALGRIALYQHRGRNAPQPGLAIS